MTGMRQLRAPRAIAAFDDAIALARMLADPAALEQMRDQLRAEYEQAVAASNDALAASQALSVERQAALKEIAERGNDAARDIANQRAAWEREEISRRQELIQEANRLADRAGELGNLAGELGAKEERLNARAAGLDAREHELSKLEQAVRDKLAEADALLSRMKG